MSAIRRLSAVLVAAALCVLPAAALTPESHPTIRVGYWQDYGISMDEYGRLSGYGYDYLTEIARVNGWRLEFVDCSWSEGLQMLADGDIDIFGAMQYTPERALLFDYPDMSFGYEYGALYVSENNTDIFYNDPESLDGKIVGNPINNYFTALLSEYCEENGIEIQYRYIEDSNLLQAALDNGEIDLMLSGSIRSVPRAKVALRVGDPPIYYTTTKGNQMVLDGLNHALRVIKQANIYFDAELHEKHFQHTAISAEAFTREERAYIDEHTTLKMAFHSDWNPMEYYDERNQALTGISVDIARYIARYLGVEFEFIHPDSYADALEMTRSGEVDIVSGLIESQMIKDEFRLLSSSLYIDSSFVFVGRRGSDISPAMSATSTISQNSVGTLYWLQQYYPHIDVLTRPTISACLDAVLLGQADYVVLNSYVADTAMRSSRYNELAVTTAMQGSIPVGFGVSENADPLLLSILNKAVKSISPDFINSVVFRHTVGVPYQITVEERVKQNLPALLAIVCVFSILFLLYVWWSTRLRSRKLNELAYYDTLTGQFNLVRFKLDLGRLLAESPGGSWAVLSLDIDKFKSVNDLRGYEYGDRLIVHLSDCIDATLTDGEFFARENADKFILLMRYADRRTFDDRFNALTRRVDAIKALSSTDMKMILSGGLYLIQPDDHNITAIIDKASLARKTVKDSHRSEYGVYDRQMYDRLNAEKQIENIMDHALSHHEFVVFLQPKFSVYDKSLVGAEALVRWQHPERGLIPPNEFIPLFEKNGFITSLDFYVFRAVCARLREWSDSGHALVPVSVNLSRRHFENHDLARQLGDIAAGYGVPPRRIELELTESAFIDDASGNLIAMMRRLREAGFILSMDDFGSGLSSLTQLKDLPIDVLKLDKTFFSTSSEHVREMALFRNVVNLSKDMGIMTVAEGVETEEQYKMLYESGCDMAQGYLFGRPMPVADFEETFFSQRA